jgi:hypothetical protein
MAISSGEYFYPECNDSAAPVDVPDGELQTAIQAALAAREEVQRLEALRQQAASLPALLEQATLQADRQAAQQQVTAVFEETKTQLAGLPERRQRWLVKVETAARLIAEARAEQAELQRVISTAGYRLQQAVNYANSIGADLATFDPSRPLQANTGPADFAELWHQAGGDNPALVLSLALLVLNKPELRELAAMLQPAREQKYYHGVKYFY